jgi:hypothetical protein
MRDGAPAGAPAGGTGLQPGRPDSYGGGEPRAARAEAARLLSLARVPPRAVRLDHPPRSLSGPALGRPEVASLVDRVLAWRVGLPFTVVQAWLSAHAPRGLRPDGSASSGDAITGRATMADAGYRGPASRAWQSAGLEISTALAGPVASVIRVDALVVWLDPRPVPSGPGAHPIRVTVTGGCPATDRGVTGVANTGAGLTRRLLPPGQQPPVCAAATTVSTGTRGTWPPPRSSPPWQLSKRPDR